MLKKVKGASPKKILTFGGGHFVPFGSLFLTKVDKFWGAFSRNWEGVGGFPFIVIAPFPGGCSPYLKFEK